MTCAIPGLGRGYYGYARNPSTSSRRRNRITPSAAVISSCSALQGSSVAGGVVGAATRELAAQLIAKELYPGVKPENLTNEKKRMSAH
ncbi:hypothetical protein [Rahnella sikkimica]|uniref:hypothetical protein n=1 Tax=Rahnella sikkimica TaxID=1805933 RepID=UPI001CFFFA0E|nr:hypothetical protein [Rahnella sikkimica]